LAQRAAPAALARLGEAVAGGWRLGEPFAGRGDTCVFAVRDDAGSPALLKAAGTRQGRHQLERQVEVLAALHADDRLGPWARLVLSDHACAIDDGGGASCWGNNATGEVLAGPPSIVKTPTPIAGAWTRIAVGDHTCGVDTSNNLSCWGRDDSGDLGPNSMTGTPPFIVPGAPWTQVAAGIRVSCGLQSTGLVCWGLDDAGAIGDGPPHSGGPNPAAVALPSANVADVTYSGAHGCARIGTAGYCWGANDRGQLADQTTTPRDAPIQLPMTWDQLSAGIQFTCGLSSGSLWCWGANEFGQLGDGTFVERHGPVQVGTDTDWIDVSAGTQHACARKPDTTTYCWGRNVEGEIGDGAAWRATFVAVP